MVILEVHVVAAAGVPDISFVVVEAQLSGAFADSRALLWLEVLPLGSTKGEGAVVAFDMRLIELDTSGIA